MGAGVGLRSSPPRRTALLEAHMGTRPSEPAHDPIHEPLHDSIQELQLMPAGRERDALTKVLPQIYEELRRVARYHLRQQRPNHTLQTTALVHEAFLRLARENSPAFENRSHLVGIAGQLIALDSGGLRAQPTDGEARGRRGTARAGGHDRSRGSGAHRRWICSRWMRRCKNWRSWTNSNPELSSCAISADFRSRRRRMR